VRIESLDHLVLTVRDVEATIDFYAHMLGASPVSFGEGRLVVEGPVERQGAAGTLLSVYVRDPDGNLVEISNVL